MLPEDFDAWLETMGFSGPESAHRLGLAKDAVVRYRRTGPPLSIALACAALAAGLVAYRVPIDSVAAPRAGRPADAGAQEVGREKLTAAYANAK